MRRPTKRRHDPRKPSYEDEVVGYNVHYWRVVRGLSQTDLANGSGVTFQQVQKYEKGSNRISWGRLTRIAKTLKIPRAALLDGCEDERALASIKLFHSIGAYRLARAFVSIPNRNLQQHLAEVVERTATAAPRKRKKRRLRRNGRKANAR
ncbi:MAG: helix-turn-helix transcriptional regulator [Hyphomicrobiales bacterium]|nr:helix-turn-helix transcriptional regulator [Hyphomicrobiales bacterium]MBV9427962.1 helix-turn-helix transcriptional regulator [Bradyrhizobiaceae bacterium]